MCKYFFTCGLRIPKGAPIFPRILDTAVLNIGGRLVTNGALADRADPTEVDARCETTDPL